MSKTTDASAGAVPEEGVPGRTGSPTAEGSEAVSETPAAPAEIGGRKGPDPTRYGDWEKNGRCIDF